MSARRIVSTALYPLYYQTYISNIALNWVNFPFKVKGNALHKLKNVWEKLRKLLRKIWDAYQYYFLKYAGKYGEHFNMDKDS